MAIIKNSSEYNMMAKLYKLYTLSMEDLTSENQTKLATMQNEFEKEFANVFGIKEFSHAIELMYLKRLKQDGQIK